MNLSDESKAFYHAVYSVIHQVPYGHATSYGHIAYLANKPQNSRQVGSALKNSKIILPALNTQLNENEQLNDNLPWWRIVSSTGKISPRLESFSEVLQADILRGEGVEVLEANIVDFDQCGWFPDEVNY